MRGLIFPDEPKPTVKELNTQPKVRGKKGYYQMRKSEIIDALKNSKQFIEVPNVKIQSLRCYKLLKKENDNFKKELLAKY